MNLLPVEHFFEHICHHFWVGATANPPKSNDRYAQESVQLVRGSSLQSDFLQNPYFSVVKMQQHRTNRNAHLERISTHCEILNELFS